MEYEFGYSVAFYDPTKPSRCTSYDPISALRIKSVCLGLWGILLSKS